MADSYVTSTATLQCSCGLTPAKLVVLPDRRVMLANKPMATIMDSKPMVNIPSFGMCSSLAKGVLTPMPCVPNTPFPWVGGKLNYLIGNQPALMKSCTCQCLWAGSISIITDGQIV